MGFPFFEPAPYTPDPEMLVTLISAMYQPANSASSADELVSGLEVLEALRETDPELTAKHVYDAMLGMGFIPKNIEGHVYWPVMDK